MSKITYCEGDVILTSKKDTLIHAFNGDLIFTAGEKNLWKGKNTEIGNYVPTAIGEQNKNFIACIEFYRSLDNSTGKFGFQDKQYNGEFGFDRFDKKVCAEGLASKYIKLPSVIPSAETYSGKNEYLSPYLTIWGPGIPENPNNKKSKVFLFVKANKANTKGLKEQGEIEFSCSEEGVLKITPNTLNMSIGSDAQKIEIECLKPFKNDIFITAKAKDEPQELGKIILKANATIYTTKIQPVEIVYTNGGDDMRIQDIPNEDFITKLVKAFNEKSFNQAYIFGELTGGSKKITLDRKKFKQDLLYISDEDQKLYLKKTSEGDPDTAGYNSIVEENYAGLLKDLRSLKMVKNEVVKAADSFLEKFDEKFDFENQNKEINPDTNRLKIRPKDIELKDVRKAKEKFIADKAWTNPEVQAAYKRYEGTRSRYDEEAKKIENGSTKLNKNGILHIFYTRSIYAAANPKAKVHAYSNIGSGVAHVFGVVLEEDTNASKSAENIGVILHEIAHSMGLLHSFDGDDIFYGLPAQSDEEREIKENKQKIEDIEGEKDTYEIGEIKIIEQKLDILKDKTIAKSDADQLQKLKIEYNSLAIMIRGRGADDLSRIKNKITETIDLEKTQSTSSSTIDSVSKTREQKELTDEIERKKQELKTAKEILKKTKVKPYGKEQSKTEENYMDYMQDKNGIINSNFSRKSFYQWQWGVMRPDKRKVSLISKTIE